MKLSDGAKDENCRDGRDGANRTRNSRNFFPRAVRWAPLRRRPEGGESAPQRHPDKHQRQDATSPEALVQLPVWVSVPLLTSVEPE